MISSLFKRIERFPSTSANYGVRSNDSSKENNLFVLLLMAILSQSFLTLMRRNLMTLTLFTTRHTQFNF